MTASTCFHWRTSLALLLAFLMALPAGAQTASSNKIREQVRELPVGCRVTVNMRDGAQYCGTIGAIERDAFLVHEVDLKRDLTIRYDDVQRVRKDYGRPGFGGRRVHPRTNRIAGLFIVAGLILLVAVAVALDKS